MTNTTVELVKILTDKLSNLPSASIERAKFYEAQIAKLIDAYCKEH